MTEQAKQEFPAVNPWDVLVWKLDSLEKHVQREIAGLRDETGALRREMEALRQELKQETATLRQELKQETAALRQELKQETATLRQELKQETAALRQELAEEIRASRRSYTMLEITVVVGFVAVVVTLVLTLARLVS